MKGGKGDVVEAECEGKVCVCVYGVGVMKGRDFEGIVRGRGCEGEEF